MADHPNAALLKQGYEAFSQGDMATITSLFAEDVVWHAFGSNPLAGVHRGRDAVFAIFAKTAELSGGTFKIDVHDVVANDDHAVAITTATGTREGRSLNSMDTDVYHMKDGKITEWWSFVEDDRATDAFWS
jgi:hypothetical protein